MPTAELHKLNHDIVAIIKARRQRQTFQQLAKFSIGDHVAFEAESGLVKGHVARVNQKTVSVDAYEPHGHWRISPGHLKRLGDSPKSLGSSNVLDLFQR
jgi:hypothetical protein